MKSLILVLLTLALPAVAAEKKITYFSCPVKEGRTEVSVKFAVENYDPFEAKGDLLAYPGADEDNGFILVTPTQKRDGYYTRMSNLNGQGGDLRILKNGDVELYGDGDGIQTTYLHLWWDASDLAETTSMEGYVRDYTDGEDVMFKQFIKCELSNKVL